MKTNYQLRGCMEIYIDSLEIHIIPFLWLFIISPHEGIRFDGMVFWSIYAIICIIYGYFTWNENRFMSSLHDSEEKISTPIRSFVVALMHPLNYFLMVTLYFYFG